MLGLGKKFFAQKKTTFPPMSRASAFTSATFQMKASGVSPKSYILNMHICLRPFKRDTGTHKFHTNNQNTQPVLLFL